MKKYFKAISVALAPIIALSALFAGCKSCGTSVDIDNGNDGGIMRDADLTPTLTAVYEEYTKSALESYRGVAERHEIDGETDIYNAEVVSAASEAAAKLFAYACYNERYLDRYVYFGNQEGLTDLGASGSANAVRQEYYLRVNEGENTCGYRYHYTLKKVVSSSGIVGGFKSQFESARLRFTDKTNLLYRFEGENIRFGEDSQTLECDWETGKDWGKPDIEMIKGEYIAPEDIAADIVESADKDNCTIRGNVNILAENVVKFASIYEDDGFVNVMMTIDTEVANNDEASLAMLRSANGSGNCRWQSGESDPETVGIAQDTGLRIIFRLWNNGLFRSYSITERWTGTIVLLSGTAESQTVVDYSYSDRDCDMTANLKMLEEAKKLRGE